MRLLREETKMSKYMVTVKVKVIVNAGNEFAAEAEAVDLLQILPAVAEATATSTKKV